MRSKFSPIYWLSILSFLILQSCVEKSVKVENSIPTIEQVNVVKEAIPKDFESMIRPNEKLILGKVYTDTLEYVGDNDEGDNWLFIVKKQLDSIYIINNTENNFVRGDVVEIQWKMDSIRYAGDESFLDFREHLVTTKKIRPLKLTPKKVKFLWRETSYDKKFDADISRIIFDQQYLANISDPERAALGYAATFIGNGCEWDGKANENRSNLKCEILWALKLGHQCSHQHLDYLRYWFRNKPTILKELENCPTTPEGATVQDTFDEINVEVKGTEIIISFKASGFNMREGESWQWNEKQVFKFKDNQLLLVSKQSSPKNRSKFEVRGN